MDSTDILKQNAAKKAIEWVRPDEIIGIGTGSTVNYFIQELAALAHDIPGAVSSSEATSEKLREIGIPIVSLNYAGEISLYVDGADEVNTFKHLIKGGGGALTREKIIAEAANTFVCIVDRQKVVDVLGKFPLPIEVIPMARSLVARKIQQMGGKPVWRENFITDNGNEILDIHHLQIAEPQALETALNEIPGVVTVGLFAHRKADVVIVGDEPVRVQ
ncbi:ribose-5-phosphate isomerase RpiA [Ostreibacterium oceani]|uniref:Ribose-5-phosphate isomerase A n=1 Tax=Ostreibacterium oceani TaxID=2654998 RepID=A0A6N7EZ45_9GAMM|nr:ribose-5-phosphate isomerase RpiA [Ostreibacterium oceani]MPV86830.1 ribose-5-phosphate isomerase RpiA [Ostreibacterium oceani]